ncbi:UNVERIFIED_CONTAM: hypothetical protein H355_013181 [Colinus virginianus]|nr:hypothetical protein H355_013181 [Colinus virginianus]
MENCSLRAAPLKEEDVIILNGNKEDVEVLKKRMEDRRLKSKLEKKSKKCKSAESAGQQVTAEDSPGPSKVKNRKDCVGSGSGEKRQIIFTKSSAFPAFKMNKKDGILIRLHSMGTLPVSQDFNLISIQLPRTGAVIVFDSNAAEHKEVAALLSALELVFQGDPLCCGDTTCDCENSSHPQGFLPFLDRLSPHSSPERSFPMPGGREQLSSHPFLWLRSEAVLLGAVISGLDHHVISQDRCDLERAAFLPC